MSGNVLQNKLPLLPNKMDLLRNKMRLLRNRMVLRRNKMDLLRRKMLLLRRKMLPLRRKMLPLCSKMVLLRSKMILFWKTTGFNTTQTPLTRLHSYTSSQTRPFDTLSLLMFAFTGLLFEWISPQMRSMAKKSKEIDRRSTRSLPVQ